MRLLAVVLWSAVAAAGPSGSLVVNGGNTPTGNLSVNERELVFFHKLFGGKGAMLNGAGPQTLMAVIGEKGYERDEKGALVLKSSTLTGTGRANQVQVLRELKTLKESGGDSLALYFGDHGGPKGPSLWDKTQITGQELVDWTANLPKATVVKRVHLHCYAAAALVKTDRERPKKLEGWDDFLKKNYPENKCGMAYARHDELGDYIDWTEKEGEGKWDNFLKKNPNPTLKDMRDFIYAMNDVANLPVLTSDYLIEDLTAFFCEGDRAPKHEETPREKEGEISPGPCSEAFAKEWSDADKAFQEGLKVWSEAGAIRSETTTDFMTLKFPEATNEYRAAVASLEKLRATAQVADALVELGVKTPGPTTLNSIVSFAATQFAREAIERGVVAEYDRLWTGVKHGKAYAEDFKKFYSSEAAKKHRASEGFTKKYPILAATLNKPDNLEKDLYDILYAETRVADKTQKTRKQLGYRQAKTRRDFVEERLKDPRYAEVKRVYDTITACETSAVN